jgi:hypothetical protein
MPTRARPKVLFLRRIRAFRGAHLTAWNCFGHLAASGVYDPFIWFSEDSIRGAENPWSAVPDRVVAAWRAEDYDALVVGGRDWKFLTPEERDRPPLPVLHLVCHVKRADPADETFGFLRHPAIRVCISDEVAARVAASGVVRGPVHANPHGLDTSGFPPVRADAARRVDVLVAGVKRPDLAGEIGRRLAKNPAVAGSRVEVLTERLPRAEFLSRVAAARVVVLLPNPSEGFYRPLLEAMALRTFVVCPAFVGSGVACAAGDDCLMPPYDTEAVVEAAANALRLPPARRAAMVEAAFKKATRRTIEDERRGFLAILEAEARNGRWPRPA